MTKRLRVGTRNSPRYLVNLASQYGRGSRSASRRVPSRSNPRAIANFHVRQLANQAARTAVDAVTQTLPVPARAAVRLAAKAVQTGVNKWWKSRTPGNGGLAIRPLSGLSTARYVGRFKKPQRRLTKVGNMEALYAKRGFVLKRETHGGVADPSCVYLGASTFNRISFVETMYGAVIRKLLKKAGVDIQSPGQIPSMQNFQPAGIGQPVGGGFFVKLQYLDENGTQNQLRDFWNDTTTFEQFTLGLNGTANTIYNCIFNNLDSDNGFNVRQYTHIGLYYDIGGTNPDRMIAVLNLEDEYVNFKSKVAMCIQNRTKGNSIADGEQFSSERIDNQPLKGYQYVFSSAQPRVRGTTAQGNPQLLTVIPNNEYVNLVKSTQLPGVLFREPPNPRTFGNCIGSSYVKLQPGTIKKGVVYHELRGSWNSIMCKRMVTDYGGQGPLPYLPGRYLLFALEEIINSGSPNNIEVAYECERFTGAFLTTKKKTAMISNFQENGYSNV